MRKILYIIIAFLFCAECNNGNQQNRYNDGKFIIINGAIYLKLNIDNIKNNRMKKILEQKWYHGFVHVGQYSKLCNHLYNNGHIIFGDDVDNFGALIDIVRARYGIVGRRDVEYDRQLRDALDRREISYVILSDLSEIIYNNGENEDSFQKIYDMIQDRAFLNDENIFGNTNRNNVRVINVVNDDGIIKLTIDVRIVENKNWKYLNRQHDDGNGAFQIIADRIRAYIKIKNNEIYLATAYII